MTNSIPSLSRTTRHIERRLAEFVDRDTEMQKFRAVLASEDQPIMLVHGGTGIGKTSLLLRMVHECATQRLRKAELVWNETHPHDYLAVMRKIRDDVGIEHFVAFTDLINYYTDEAYRPKFEVAIVLQGGTTSVASGMHVRDSTVGDLAGVLIKDNMFVVQRADLAIPEATRREHLTARFLKGLQAAAESARVVVFFDAAEKMSADTNSWMWEQLLDAVRTGGLRNVRFVICGQRKPPDDRDWDDYLVAAELNPLRVEDIAAYVKKRAPHIAEDTARELAKLLYQFTKGRPAEVAVAVDTYLKNALT